MIKPISTAVIAALLISGSSVRAQDAMDLRQPDTLHEAVRAATHDGPVLQRAVTPDARETSAGNAPRVQQAQRGKKEQVARGVLGAVAGAVGGFFAGGFAGSKLEPSCRCDDPGLRGFLIGAPIGAVAGAVIGARAATQ